MFLAHVVVITRVTSVICVSKLTFSSMLCLHKLFLFIFRELVPLKELWLMLVIAYVCSSDLSPCVCSVQTLICVSSCVHYIVTCK